MGLSGAEIGAELVEVPFDHGGRVRIVAADECRSEIRKRGEAAGIEGVTKGGDDGRKQGGMKKSDMLAHVGGWDCCIGGERRAAGERRRGVWEC